jgi:hypothetical protein
MEKGRGRSNDLAVGDAMPHYLFSLGLVPVQSWIEEARRSRDLQAGSVILWWTMARVLHTLETELRVLTVMDGRSADPGQNTLGRG